jgi:hypothetical protein
MEMIQLAGGQLNLLETIYDVLRTSDKWPPYRYLEDYLYRRFKLDIDDVRETLPTNLTSLPPPGYPANDQQEISLTIEGLRYVELPGASDDVELFFRVFRRFVMEDERIEPIVEGQPNPCLTVSDLSEEWRIHPSPLRRVLRIAGFEPWPSGWSTMGVDNSDFRLCAQPRSLRRFAQAITLDQYLALRRKVYPVGPPPESPLKAFQTATERLAASARNLTAAPRSAPPREPKEWDVFICHASADKESFVRGLSDALTTAGLKVWYDEFELTVGDSLQRKIDEGLARSNYGIVVFSHHFFETNWPQTELDGLAARQNSEGRKVILPVLHNFTIAQLRQKSPTLAGLLAVSSERGTPYVVQQLLRAMQFPPPPEVAARLP